ncbi:MAG: TolC family protein [Paracoccaceae bacterium]
MNYTRPIRKRENSCWRSATAVAACVLLAGCAGLPGPGVTEAAISERAERLTTLTAASGHDVTSVARNGLLLSPSVREAASLVSASADEVRVQRAALFPGLRLSAYGGVGSSGSADPSIELTGSQLLFDGDDSQRAVSMADFNLQISYIAFQKAVDDAVLEVLKTYDDVQMQSELFEVYKNQLAALRELRSLVAARATSGAAPSTDVLEARKRTQSAAFLVNDTELALAEARDRLILLSGQSQGGHVRIFPATCAARGETDSVRTARLELSRAQVALARAENALTPRVFLKPVVGGKLSFNEFPIGINIDIQSDLLQGGALTAKANAARNNLAAAEANLEVVSLEDDLAGRGLLRSLTAGDRKTDMLERQIDLLSETRALYRNQYFDMGTRQISELLDNEEEYYGRQAELVELRAELAADRLDCAVRNRVLRRELELESNSIYGYPLASKSI